MPIPLPLVVANWKMHKTQSETAAFIQKLAPFLKECSVSVWLAVPFTAIQVARETLEALQEKQSFLIGAQNMHDALEGPFTGEIGATMIKEVGAQFVILGHSERRQLFGERDDFINKKVKRALEEDLLPVLCVGETREEREKGGAAGVVEAQLSRGLEGVSSEQAASLVIAYEPVWAIGTGLVATPSQAQEMHHLIRVFLEKRWGRAISRQIPLLYGGSAKPESVEKLEEEKDVDGFLVGGASLSSDSFTQIISTLSKRSDS